MRVFNGTTQGRHVLELTGGTKAYGNQTFAFQVSLRTSHKLVGEEATYMRQHLSHANHTIDLHKWRSTNETPKTSSISVSRLREFF